MPPHLSPQDLETYNIILTNLNNAKSIWGETSAQYRAALEIANSARGDISASTELAKAPLVSGHQPQPKSEGLKLAFRPK